MCHLTDLRVYHEGDTLMVISSSHIRAFIDKNPTKGLARSFSVTTSSSSKGETNVLEISKDATQMREGDQGQQYTDFNPVNIFLGLNAGINTEPGSLLAGQLNTFIGNNAGRLNTSGKYNVFMGYNSGYRNTTGDNNIFIGLDAGLGQTSGLTGSNNVFIGKETGRFTTTGLSNVFIGSGAGYLNTTGKSNVFVGNNAGGQIQDGEMTGDNNVFMGTRSGFRNKSGEDNVFLGAHTGENNVSGNSNVYLGRYAGNQNVGSSNVFIGYSAGSVESNISNKLYIANSSTGTPLIKGTFPNVDLDLTATNIRLNGTLNGNMSSVTTSGNNFFRVTSPSGSSPGIDLFRPGNGFYDWRIYNTGGNLRIGNSGDDLSTVTDMVHITTSGNVGIGTTDPGSYKLYVSGSAYSTGGWASSDVRYKTNIKTIDSSLTKVLSMRGVVYEWLDSEFPEMSFGKGGQIGVIAQEVEDIFPELVFTNEDGYKAVAYDKLSAVLIEATKEQQKIISDQEDRIAKLEGMMEKMLKINENL